MIATLLLAQILAAAPATTATPVVKADTGQTRTLADVARERKLGVKLMTPGVFSVATSTATPATGKMTDQEKWELENGEPLHRNVTITVNGGTSEQLVYPNGVY